MTETRPGFWKRFGPVVEAWVVFVVSAAVMIMILIWSRPFTDSILPRWIASYTALALKLMGLGGKVQNTVVNSSLGSVEIIRECTGVYPTALYLAAVFAYRCSWRSKLLGIFGGIIAIQVLNLIRIVSLMLVLKWSPDSFEFMHLTVWQSLMVFLTALLWLLWSTELTRPRK